MEWLVNHSDTALLMVTIISSVLGATMWLNGKFNDMDRRMTIIETVLLCKGIMPNAIEKLEMK